MPMRLRVTSRMACASVASRATVGSASPLRITSLTWVSRRRPSAPPGCDEAKSAAPKPRASSSATASASPSAIAAVVLAVGARFSGQASRATAASRCTSASAARRESVAPVIAMSRAPRRLTRGTIASSSSVLPEFDRASTTSSEITMPRSPWLASAGCMKKAGVPVEARVAAILRAMWPDLPMPLTTTRPRQARISSQARTNEPSMRCGNAAMASASICSTSTARAIRRSARAVRSASPSLEADRIVSSIGPSISASPPSAARPSCRVAAC